MTEKEIINLVLGHLHQKGALILRHKGKYYPLSYKEYSVGYAGDYHDGELFINACCTRLPDVCRVSIQEFNRSWWLVRSKEQTLGKEENHMSKPDVIIGLVAVPQKTTQIIKIIVDEKRRNVIVKFSDGDIQVVHCDKEDVFDVYVGVALAETRHKYGSTSKFHKHVDSLSVVVKEKTPKKSKQAVADSKGSTKKPKVTVKKPKTKKGGK